MSKKIRKVCGEDSSSLRKLLRLKKYQKKRKNSKDHINKYFSFKFMEQRLRRRERKRIRVLFSQTPWVSYEKMSVYWQIISQEPLEFSYEYPLDPWDEMAFELDKRKLNHWEYCWY